MDIAVYDTIVTNYVRDMDFSKYPNTEEGLKKFKKDFESMKKVILKKMRSIFKGIEDPKKIAMNLAKFKKDNNIDPEVEISEDFGKFNLERAKEKKYAEDSIEKTMTELLYKNCILRIKTPKIRGRVEQNVIKALAPTNIEEYESFCDIMQKENDEIDPITGRPYGETKAKLIVDGIDRVNQVVKEYTKVMNNKEFVDFNANYYSIIGGLGEFDNAKINQTLSLVGLTSEKTKEKYPFLAEKIDKILEFKNSFVGIGSFRTHIAIMTNPLYPYSPNNDDLAYLGTLASENDINADRKEKYESLGIGLAAEPVQGVNQVMGLYSYPKLIQSGKSIGFMNERFKDNFNIGILPIFNIKAEEVRFFVDNEEQQIDVNNNDHLTKVTDWLLEGKSVTLKDSSGKLLLDYKSSADQLVNIVGGGNGLDIATAIENGFAKGTKDVKIELGKTNNLEADIKHMKKEIRNASDKVAEKIDESVQMEIDTKIGRMLKSLQKCNPSKLRKEDTSYYNDIEDMLKDVLNKGVNKKDKKKEPITFNKDKDAYISGLKSVRTFCQAYLDENNGKKMDATSKAKYDAINGVYIDLLNVENQLTYVRDFERNLNSKLTMKARRDNPEFVKNIDDKKIERPTLESEKVMQGPRPLEDRTKLYEKEDFDPTKKNEIDKKSELVSNNKEKDLSKDVLGK